MVKSELLKLRKTIFDNLKSQALSLEKSYNTDFTTYYNDQKSASQRAFVDSDFDELLSKVESSHFIFIGDFHTFDQNIRNVLRLLKIFTTQKKPVAIAVEMVDACYQNYIDAYMNRYITELEFLDSIQYHDSWRFPWTHYKLIFDLAKQHDIKIYGINKAGTLKERDLFAAAQLKQIYNNDPQRAIFCLYGELHITHDKIPSDLNKTLPNKKKVIIHQNLDEVYWKHPDQNQDTHIVKFNAQEYCINSAPPWLKYESMIYWYENLSDDPDFDIHDYIIENGAKILSEDSLDHFNYTLQELKRICQLSIDDELLLDYNLKDHTNLEFVEDKVFKLKDKKLQSLFQYLLENSYSFRIPTSLTYYCSSYSMNRLSYLAGSHIYNCSLTRQEQDSFLESSEEGLLYFYFYLQSEAMFSYFFSKILNPYRKCDLYLDFKANEQHPEKALALQIFDQKNITQNQLKPFSLTDIYLCSRLVGHALGEYLYKKLINKKSFKDLQSYFKLTSSPQNLDSLMSKILKSIDYKSDKKRYF